MKRKMLEMQFTEEEAAPGVWFHNRWFQVLIEGELRVKIKARYLNFVTVSRVLPFRKKEHFGSLPRWKMRQFCLIGIDL